MGGCSLFCVLYEVCVELPESAGRIAEEVALQAGVEMLFVEEKGSGPTRVLRIVADVIGGISAETCASMSRQFDMLWEAEHGEQRQFGLEVTSPGPKRRLADERDFRLVTGRMIEVAYTTSVNPTEPCLGSPDDSGELSETPERTVANEVTGKVLSCTDGVLVITTDAGDVPIHLEWITKAKLVYLTGGSSVKSRRSSKRKASRRSKR